MRIVNAASSPALFGSWGQISFSELRHQIDREKNSAKSQGISTLRAEAHPRFLIPLLARLELGLPTAVLPNMLSPAELLRRQALLQGSPHPDCALVLFTSGSTGEARAVQLSAAGIQANTEAVVESLRFRDAKKQFLFLPLSFSFGLLGQLLPALAAGVATHFLEGFAEGREILERGEGAGMWSAVPSQWEIALGLTEKAHNVTHVVSAGDSLSLRLRERLRAHFPRAVIFNNYGLTEASPRVLSISSEHPRFFEHRTAGSPVKGIRIKAGPDGELLVAGPQVMLGYLGAAEASREKLAGGWLHTGDLAEISDGQLVELLGRNDELLKIGGERISPLEIDAALAQVPGVQEGAVFANQDAVYGVSLSAFLVLAPAEASGEISKDWLLEHLKARISANKIPSEFYIVDALPKTPSGKLIRASLANLPRRNVKNVAK